MKAPKYALKILSLFSLFLLAVFTARTESVESPGFSLQVSPPVRTVNAGDAAHYNLTVRFRGEYWNRIHFSFEGLPESVGTPVFDPGSVENPSMGTGGGAAEAKLGIETLPSAPAGEYPFVIAAGNESGHETVQAVLIIRETDFTLEAEPAARTVKQGDETWFDVQADPVGFVHPVRLEAFGMPAGTEAAFDADSLGPDQQDTKLRIKTGPETPVGEYNLKIVGTAEEMQRETSIVLIVEAEKEDFTLRAEPAARTINQGEAASFDVQVHCFHCVRPVNLEVTGLPQNTGAVFVPDSFAETGNSLLTVETAQDTQPGQYTLVVSATGGDLRRDATLVLNIKEKGDFSLNIAPERMTVLPGNTADYTVGVLFSGEFPDPVELDTESLPQGMRGILKPGTVHESGQTAFSVIVGESVEPGDYTLTITGTGGGLTRSDTAVLVVETPKEESDFTLTASPASFSFNPGESASADVSVSFVGVCEGPVALTLSGIPEDWSATLASDTLSPDRPATVLEIGTPESARPGEHAITVSGGGCDLSKTTAVVVRIRETAPLTISKAQRASTLVPGQEQEYLLKIVNAGNSPASGVIVTDELNEHLTYKDDTSAGAVHETEGRTHRWTFSESLEPGGQIEFAIRATVSEDIRAGTVIENTGYVEGGLQPGPASSNTVRAVSSFVPVDSGSLVVAKRVNRREAKPGAILVYTVRIENRSAGTIFDISLEDRLPNGFLLVEGKTRLNGKPFADPDGRRRLLWNLGNLSAGGSKRLKYQVLVGTNARSGRNTNLAIARGADGNGKKIESEGEATVSLGAAEMEISGEIRAYAFADTDGNGVFGADETGIAGIPVILSSGDKRLTDKHGEALFEEVLPGRYVAAVDERALPEGARVSGEASTLVSVLEAEEAEVEFPIIRAGEETGQIEILIYLDRNKNFVFDGNDSPMPGIPVGISSGERRTTGKTGRALFAEVAPGETSAFPDIGMLPSFVRIPGETSQTVRVLGGEKSEVSFPAVWVHRYARLAGRVFFDRNRNGSYDEDGDILAEQFIAEISGKRTRGKNGTFVFTRIEPGWHTLNIDRGGGRVSKQVELAAGRNTIDIPIEWGGVKVIVGVSQ